jgi:hypothetical protein
MLIAAGLSIPREHVNGQLTPRQRKALAVRISKGIPLSQIVIEERGIPL